MKLGPLVWQFMPTKRFEAGRLRGVPRAAARMRLDGRPLRHVLDVRHESFLSPQYLALARRYQAATVFTDSDDYPTLRRHHRRLRLLPRMMRTDAALPEGCTPQALAQIAACATAVARRRRAGGPAAHRGGAAADRARATCSCSSSAARRRRRPPRRWRCCVICDRSAPRWSAGSCRRRGVTPLAPRNDDALPAGRPRRWSAGSRSKPPGNATGAATQGCTWILPDPHPRPASRRRPRARAPSALAGSIAAARGSARWPASGRPGQSTFTLQSATCRVLP